MSPGLDTCTATNLCTVPGKRRCRGHARRLAIGLMASAVVLHVVRADRRGLARKLETQIHPHRLHSPVVIWPRSWPCFIATSFHFPQAEEMRKLRRDEMRILFPTLTVSCELHDVIAVLSFLVITPGQSRATSANPRQFETSMGVPLSTDGLAVAQWFGVLSLNHSPGPVEPGRDRWRAGR
jgi:hypothetical protein